MIAIPTVSNQINSVLVEFLCWLFAQSDRSRFIFDLTVIRQRFPHHYARNLCVRSFLMSDSEKLWFIDDDILPTATMLRVLEHDADIVSGLYHVLKMAQNETTYDPKPLLFRVSEQGHVAGFFHSSPPNENELVQEIDAAGAGCLLIKRHVLEDKRMWLSSQYTALDGQVHDYLAENLPGNKKWAPPIFRHQWKPGGDELRSEDIDFVWRAKQLGYKAVGDFGARCGHLKICDAQMVGTTIATAALAALRMAGAIPEDADTPQETAVPQEVQP